MKDVAPDVGGETLRGVRAAGDADLATTTPPFPDRRPWRKYLALANLAMQRALAYRARYVVGAFAGLFQIGILFYLWRAFYAGGRDLAGYGWADIRTYLFLTFILNLLLTFQTETQMSAGLRDGSIALDLVKPLDYQRARLAEASGAALMEGAVFGVGALPLAVLLFGVSPPAGGPAGLALVAAALAGAFLLKFLLAFLTGVLAFWTTSGVGLIMARNTITLFFSGGLVPLAFFPDWLERLALVLPFQGTIHTPVAVYLGRVSGAGAIVAIGIQFGWVLLLWWAARLLFRAGVRNVTVHGG